MRIARLTVACTAALIIGSGSPAFAGVRVSSEMRSSSPDQGLLRLAVEGTIDADDAKKFADLLRSLDVKYKKWFAIVDLNSTGGNMQAAVTIGRLLRTREFAASVDRGASCLSACVYVLAGAPRRIVNEYATIGIHRPYDPNDTADSVHQQKAKQVEWGKLASAYLQEMNIPLRLYEDSLFISPDRMKVLTSDEIAKYGLSANDPYLDEADEIREAKRLGLTRVELGKRKAEARRRCGMDRMTDDTPVSELSKAVTCMDSYIKGK